MWRLIGITPESLVENEHSRIIEFLNGQIDYFHIRKPQFSEEEMIEYIKKFPIEIREKLSLHDFHNLAFEFGIGGIHLNSRNRVINRDFIKKRISCSCHSLDEIKNKIKFCDYLFLSPIYNSISKKGHKSQFEIQDLKKSNLINDKIIALGGVTIEKFEELKEIGFGGAAMLGKLWKNK